MIRMISGNTGYIPGAVNIGVYRHGVKECTIVDTGLDSSAAKTILKALNNEEMNIKRIIITHAHADHTGGAARLLRDAPAEIFATSWEAAIIENPLLEPFYLYSAYPLTDLQTKFFLASPCANVTLIQPGTVLDDLSIADLSGHSPGQIGVRTPDGVYFVADAFFSEAVLEKYYIPYFADIAKAKSTLETLLSEPAAFYLPAHGVLMQDIQITVQKNLDRLTAIETDILRYLEKVDLSREEIVSQFVCEKNIDLNMGQYHLVSATIASFLAFMKEEDRIRPVFTEGFLKWSSTA
jgi:glyoxylase-like metal-dependent hydrolase (beta-lactamase superfamily II)